MDCNLQRAKIIENETHTVVGCLTRHFGNTRISITKSFCVLYVQSNTTTFHTVVQ